MQKCYSLQYTVSVCSNSCSVARTFRNGNFVEVTGELGPEFIILKETKIWLGKSLCMDWRGGRKWVSKKSQGLQNVFKGTVTWEGLFVIQTYTAYKTRILKFFGFGQKLVEIGKFFRLFCLAYSSYTQRALFKVKITKNKISIGQFMSPHPISRNTVPLTSSCIVVSKNLFLHILHSFYSF